MAISSVGTVIYQGATGTTSAVVGRITKISLDGVEVSTIDTTGISSSTKDYVCGQLNGGTVTVTTYAETGSSNLPLQPTAGNATTTIYRILFGGSEVVVSFNGYLMKTSPKVGIDEAVEITYEFKISGAVSST